MPPPFRIRRDDVINGKLPPGLGPAHKLAMALPQVQKLAKRHPPHLVLGEMEVGDAVIEQPGKQLFTDYPARVFFGSLSLTTFLLVPRYMACMMAFLHPARS